MLWTQWQQVRRQCMNKLRAQMKPFQFTKRDEERKLLRMCHSSPDLRDFSDTLTKPKPFKAKPVPKNLFSSYVYQKMREDEYYRSLKKKIRAEELLKSSSLPPSMAARERLFKAKALSAEVYNSDSDGLKRRKHKIPNYKKSHEQLQKELEDRWNDNITTSPQPFTLRTAELHKRKSAKFTSPDESSAVSPYEVYPYTDSRRHVRSQSALGIPLNRNNLASVLRIQSSRQRMERELAVRQEESRKKEVERFKAHVTRCKPAWQALNYSTEEDLAMRIQARREEERIRREEYQEDMQLMLSRVEKIPTLFERQSQYMMKEIHKKYRMPERKLRHNMKIMSVPNTPDLYEEDEREDDGLFQSSSF
ncbi:protein FAM161A-like isoform X3 [Zootermopsis nevadensis]|uniref:protein FAM161A-like isoform X3 n=1 Tax=Zootermopsis nevadensis TaxID=136037 RepID=UPI000B8E8712|nr:protein FAM161A-like isoform X3 [Zootermopsis nevadensis]